MKDEKFNPLVSIIIPVYNGSNFVKEAIDSALAQTYKNIEIIVVNDGSTDNTEEIVKQYGDKLRYFKKENGGVSSALNLAIEKSQGEYISWLSHDDVYLKDKIRINIKTLAELPEAKRLNTILYSDYIVINEDSNLIWERHCQQQHQIEKLNSPFYPLFNGLLHGCSLLIPKRCFIEVGNFDPKLKTTQDYDLWYKMFPKYNIQFIGTSTIKSRYHSAQGSKTMIYKKECDDLWINMISNLDNEQINFMSGGLLPFYKNTLKIVSDAGFTGAAAYIEQKLNEYKNRDQRNILVSVIVPFYNRIGWTLEAIKSVMTQTHENWELILVNDASTENIDAIVSATEKDKRIRLINNEKNLGDLRSRNIGIQQALGEFVAFLDSDDLFLPNKIAFQLDFMLQESVMISHTSYLLFDDKSSDVKIINSGEIDILYPGIIANCPIAVPTVMVHRDIFTNKSNLFPETVQLGKNVGPCQGADCCLWMLLSKSFLIKGCNAVLTKVRRHENQGAYNNKILIRGLTNILSFSVANFLDEKSASAIISLSNTLQYLISKEYLNNGVTDHDEKSNPYVRIAELQKQNADLLNSRAIRLSRKLSQYPTLLKLAKCCWSIYAFLLPKIKRKTFHNKTGCNQRLESKTRLPKILIIAMLHSIHAKRWIWQLIDSEFEIHLFPSVDWDGNIDKKFLNKKNVIIHGCGLNNDEAIAFPYNYDRLVIKPKCIVSELIKIIDEVKPDVIHSMEMQQAGYLVLQAKKEYAGKFPKWIYTCWGSDIYACGRLAKHEASVKTVLAECDYLSSDGQRDIKLAKTYGFCGKILPIVPVFCGFDLIKLNKLRNEKPPSERKLIALKGYQNDYGRALVGLRALERCADLLSDYEIAIYSSQANTSVSIRAELFSKATNIPIKIIPQTPDVEIIYRLHGQSRISIGLSISDGPSTSMLETMMMGSFPIQSWTSSSDEWITDGENGILVPPEDPEIIEKAIRHALTDDELVDSAAAKNWEIAKKRLDIKINKPQIIKNYEIVLGK